MDVVSACPLRVASIAWQPAGGACALTVIAVASFKLAPGESSLDEDQDVPNEADGHWDDDARRSLHIASDLAPFKRRADVFVVGHAYAPGGEPVSSLLTRLIVADIDKFIAVYGDRVFSPDGALRAPARFSRMPLRWERAAGGPDTSNPVGIRAGASPDSLGMTPVPNLQPPGTHVAMRGDFIEPVGYAPIAPTWPSRIAKLHKHAASWDPQRWNRKPLPGDIDAAYFNAAPSDQYLDEIRPSERIVLENLHPQHPRLVTNLAPVAPAAVVERERGTKEPLRLRCDTLSIDTDRGRCSLVWRGVVSLRSPREAGQVVVTLSDARKSAPPPMPLGGGPKRVITLVGSEAGGAVLPFVPTPGAPPVTPRSQPDLAALPFLPSSGASPASPRSPAALLMPPVTPSAEAPALMPRPPSALDALPFTPNAGPNTRVPEVTPRSLPVPDTASWAMPFKATAEMPPPPQISASLPTPPPTPPPPSPPPDSITDVDALSVSRHRGATALPFVAVENALAALPAVPAAPALPSGLPAGWAPSAAIPPPSAPVADPGAPPLPLGMVVEPSAPRSRSSMPPPLSAAPLTQPSAPRRAPSAPPPPLPAEEPPAPPPLIGPLSTPEMYMKTLESAAPPLALPPKAEPAASAAAPAKAEPELPLDKYPLERCAAIAASIARLPGERAAILKTHDLEGVRWHALDQHWAAAIRKETSRGRAKLLSAYDVAYVAQLEAERGPVDVIEYARIMVAVERGDEEALLSDLGLPRAARLPIQRVWLKRLAEDANLSAIARREVERLREEDP